MQQQMNQQQAMQQMMGMGSGTAMNHGAHEVLDMHEVLSTAVQTLDAYLMYQQYIKDPELMDILNRQRQFITDTYNIACESFTTGQDPTHPTTSYKMNQSNEVTYGVQPSQPKTPLQSASEIGDQCISGMMLSCMKSTAGIMTKAAAEANNPVVRRVLQDSVPNFLEMAYEIFLYQNKKQYYPLAQLEQDDMTHMMQSFAPATGMQTQSNMTMM